MTEEEAAHEERCQALMKAMFDDAMRAIVRRLRAEGHSEEAALALVEAARPQAEAQMQQVWRLLNQSQTPAIQPSGED
jgi:hypothetical protein